MPDTSGVVVTATATDLSPDPPDPPVPIPDNTKGGRYSVNQYTLLLDFSRAIESSDGSGNVMYTFSFDIHAALMQASEMNFVNLDLSINLRVYGPCTVTYNSFTDTFYMFIPGTEKYRLRVNPDAVNIVVVERETD